LFGENDDQEKIKASMIKQSKTTLTEWFSNNKKELNNPLSDEERGFDNNHKLYPSGPELHYNEYPQFYTWNRIQKKWQRRKTQKKAKTIGRVHIAHPGQCERYYLRVLLHNVMGATSFNDLNTINNTIHQTFLDSCKARGLLIYDTQL